MSSASNWFFKVCSSGSDQLPPTVKVDMKEAEQRQQEEERKKQEQAEAARKAAAAAAEAEARQREEEEKREQERIERMEQLKAEEEARIEEERKEQEKEQRAKAAAEAEQARIHDLNRKAAEERERLAAEAQAKVSEWCKQHGFVDATSQKKTMTGNTKYPLHTAVKHNMQDMVDLLVRCGADKDALDSKKQTPVDLAQKLNKNGSLDPILATLVGGA